MVCVRLFFCYSIVLLTACSEEDHTTGWEYNNPSRSCIPPADSVVYEKVPYDNYDQDTGFIRIK